MGFSLFSQKTDRFRRDLILNQSINFDLEVIFIAVPKTGTTSVRTQLRPPGEQFIPAPHLNIIQIRDLIYPYLLYMSLGKNSTYPTHDVCTNQELIERSRKLFDTFFKFSSVRNPWARAASLYFRREGVKAVDHMTFDEFCEQHIYASDTCSFPTLHVNQLDWLVDENDKVIVDYVYKVEDFETAIKEIEELTSGRINLRSKQDNKNPKSKSRSYHDIYNDHTRSLIAKRFEKDIDYFKYVF